MLTEHMYMYMDYIGYAVYHHQTTRIDANCAWGLYIYLRRLGVRYRGYYIVVS